MFIQSFGLNVANYFSTWPAINWIKVTAINYLSDHMIQLHSDMFLRFTHNQMSKLITDDVGVIYRFLRGHFCTPVFGFRRIYKCRKCVCECRVMDTHAAFAIISYRTGGVRGRFNYNSVHTHYTLACGDCWRKNRKCTQKSKRPDFNGRKKAVNHVHCLPLYWQKSLSHEWMRTAQDK
jgi:hypothetical protein